MKSVIFYYLYAPLYARVFCEVSVSFLDWTGFRDNGKSLILLISSIRAFEDSAFLAARNRRQPASAVLPALSAETQSAVTQEKLRQRGGYAILFPYPYP